MLEDITDRLACPLGEPALSTVDGGLVCTAGHRFDRARQGYVNLLGRAEPAAADTAAMVAARSSVHAAGVLAPLSEALAATVADHLGARTGPAVLDLGAGTGDHLAAVLDAVPDAVGIAIDLSRAAARRAARVHPRVGAVVADAWQRLPVRDGVVEAVLNLFAPRRLDELARVLAPGGIAVLVTPGPGHLAPLVGSLGLLTVPPGKATALAAEVAAGDGAAGLELLEQQALGWSLPLAGDLLQALVLMGPNAHHQDPVTLPARLAALAPPVEVAFEVTLTMVRRV